MIVRGDVEARHRRQGGGQQRALQCRGQALEAFAFLLGLAAGAQQLGLVRPAVPGVEDGGANEQRLPVAAGPDGGGDHDRQPGAIGRLELQRDAVDLAVHPQQGSEVGFVVEAAADGEQVAETADAHELLASPSSM